MAPHKRQDFVRRRWLRWTAIGLLLVACGALWWVRTRPTAYYRQAMQVWRDDPAQADVLLERSIGAARGSFPAAQLLRCRVLGSLERWPEALGCFSLIENPAACEQEALLAMAGEAQRAGQHLLTRLALQSADRPGPEQADCLKALLLLERADAQPEKILAYCRKLQALDPADPLAWRTEVALHQSRKQIRAGLDACRRALEQPLDVQSSRELRSELAGMLIDSGELAEARVELDRLLDANAPPEIILKDSYLLRLEKKPDEALKAVEQAIRLAPSPAAGMLRGILYVDLGRYREAAADLSAVVAAEPANKEAHYKLSQAYFKLNETEAAQRHLNESQHLTRQAIEALRRENVSPPP